MNRLLDISKTRREFRSSFLYRKCDRCDSGNSAVMWCRKCKNAHCSTCTIVHKTWREFKSHHNKVITAKEHLQSPNEILINEASKTCSVHDEQPLDLYCKTCSMLVCNSCITSKKHHNHEFDHTDKLVTKIVENVQNSVVLMKQLLNQTINRLKEIQDYEIGASSVLYVSEPSIESIDNVDGRMEEENDSNVQWTLIMAQKKRAEIMKSQLTNFLEFCSSIQNTKQLLPFNNWAMERMDDVITQVNRFLLGFTIEVTRVGYWVKLIVSLKNVYGLPATDQSKNLTIRGEEEFVQNLEIEEHLDGVYYIWYIPNRKGMHSLSAYWTKNINDTQKIEVTVNTNKQIRTVNKYDLINDIVWLKSKHRDQPVIERSHFKSKQLQFPYLIATGPNDELIVNDDSMNQLVVFDPNLTTSHTIGSKGFFELKDISGITVNNKGHVFVADKIQGCIHKFKLDGRWIHKFGNSGTGEGQFQSPHGLHVSNTMDNHGPTHGAEEIESGGKSQKLKSRKMVEYLFVCDRLNHRIQVFKNTEFAYCFGQHGAEPGRFNEPVDITLNSIEDQLFVTDTCNDRVQVFSPQGQFFRVFGNFADISADLRHPIGIYYTPDKYLLVSSYGTDSVFVFKEDGSFSLEIEGKHQSSQIFTTPCGVVMMKNRHIVIASHCSNKLIVY